MIGIIRRISCWLSGGHSLVHFKTLNVDLKRSPQLDVVGCEDCYTIWGGTLDWPLPATEKTATLVLKERGPALFTDRAREALERGDY